MSRRDDHDRRKRRRKRRLRAEGQLARGAGPEEASPRARSTAATDRWHPFTAHMRSGLTVVVQPSGILVPFDRDDGEAPTRLLADTLGILLRQSPDGKDEPQ